MLEIAKSPRRTILGTNLTIGVPTGQFFPNRLINVGTNRWGFKPEFAMSHPVGERWLIDTYAGLWLFTSNHSFYPGTSDHTQEPIGAFQAHVSYSITRLTMAEFSETPAWTALFRVRLSPARYCRPFQNRRREAASNDW